MALLVNIHVVTLKCEFEEHDDTLFHKLGSHGVTFHPREFLRYKFHVLRDLHNPYLIFAGTVKLRSRAHHLVGRSAEHVGVPSIYSSAPSR